MPKQNPVEQYLIHSYIYYELYDNIITDYEFDTLCKWMLDHYDELKHEYLYLIDKDALKAGTGHHLIGKFPASIIEKAKTLLKERSK